jgi:hypothetical protein
MEICRPLQYMTACHAKVDGLPSYSVPLELGPLLVRTTPSRRRLDHRHSFVAVPVLTTSFLFFLYTTLRHSREVLETVETQKMTRSMSCMKRANHS